MSRRGIITRPIRDFHAYVNASNAATLCAGKSLPCRTTRPCWLCVVKGLDDPRHQPAWLYSPRLGSKYLFQWSVLVSLCGPRSPRWPGCSRSLVISYAVCLRLSTALAVVLFCCLSQSKCFRNDSDSSFDNIPRLVLRGESVGE